MAPAGALYAPLVLRPRVSRWLFLLLVGAHGLALACLVPMPLPPWGGTILAGAVLLSLGSAVRRLLWRGPRAVRKAVWDAAGVWTLTFGTGATVNAELLPDSYLTQPLVILNFRVDRRRVALVLFADALDRDLLRKLRVRLRLQGCGQAQAA